MALDMAMAPLFEWIAKQVRDVVGVHCVQKVVAGRFIFFRFKGRGFA
jgi:hypothetical protein